MMKSQKDKKTWLYQLEGYYLIPHELLHILAYRLIGKPCHYWWGDHRVDSLVPKTFWERLFVLLLPFGVCWGAALFFSLLWLLSTFFINIPPERYFRDGPTWHFIFPILASLFVLYSGTAYRDLSRTWQILAGKDKTQKQRPQRH
jgi:hypothetical protein